MRSIKSWKVQKRIQTYGDARLSNCDNIFTIQEAYSNQASLRGFESEFFFYYQLER